MTLETKQLPFELKFAQGGETAGAFEGIAAAYHNVDRGGDIIAPGAFALSLAEHKSLGTKPSLLWSHNPDEIIGVIDALEETPAGLAIKGRLAVDTTKGGEAYSLAKMGAVNGLSIGYRATKATRDGKGVRTIHAAFLGEVSFVGQPMNPKARVTSIKGQKGITMSEEHNEDTGGNADIEAKIAELESKTAKIDDLETKLAAAEKRADGLELKINRPAILKAQDSREDLERKAFSTFLRHGREALGADEVKSLRVADDSAGGYLAPADFSREVDRNLVQFNPIRSVARVGSTASGSVIIPRRTGTPTAAWVGETEARSETGSTYGQIEIPIHELAGYVDVSRRLLEDSAVDIQSEVAFDVAEEAARLEGVAFVEGTGSKQPLGFMNDTNISYTAGGDASAIKADGLISIFYAMHPAYRARGTWVLNGTTLAAIRKLKDSGTGVYIWQPALQAGQPETILGRPVVEAPDMPDVGAGNFPVAFGDWSAAFRIYDRVGVSLLRDEYSVATSGLVRFHFRKRLGAGVVRAEAIRKLKIATS